MATVFLNAFLFVSTLFVAQSDTSKVETRFEDDFLGRYKTMLVNIRLQSITPDSARNEFKYIIGKVRTIFPNTTNDSSIIFPLTKYDFKAVGGKGNGFFARTYNLFDFSIKGSHPAHDIFIYDPNKDSFDDRKKQYIDVISVGRGMVIATEDSWNSESPYKGGNYVWIYDSVRGSLWYYAHLREVIVKVGQVVEQGEKLGQVGRTGSSAASERSDSHLHLMHLTLDKDLNPKPHNYYSWLLKAKSLQNPVN
ncbi:MAG: M23 family metallopeptidase [Leadbetterella sp.]